MPKLTESEFIAKAATIEMVIMDVDGVLTDGRIIITSDAKEAKSFNVKDGHGIVVARKKGLKIAWVSGRFSEVTSIRAKELGVEHLVQGEWEKLPAVKKFSSDMSIPLEKMMFIGDDVVDLESMQAVGMAVAVADACQSVIDAAGWVTSKKGGHGAIREVLDMVLDAKA